MNNKQKTTIILSLIILIAFTVSIIITVNNFQNSLHKIDLRKEQEQRYADINNDINDADKILRSSGN